MRTTILISTFAFLTLFSCDNPRTQDKHLDNIPEALEDKNSSNQIISKRGYNDLIESLYIELAEKTPELNELEKQIGNLVDSKSDSTKSFTIYDGKNKSYYQSAINHVEQINDTVLKDKIKLLIENSMTNYNKRTSKHIDLLKSIDNKNLSLNDIHLTLKITRTLPLIDKYQADALPSTNSLEGYSKQLDKTIMFADTLTKK